MRRGIRDQYDDLGSLSPPIEMKGTMEGSRNGLWNVASASCGQLTQVALHILELVGESSEIFGDEGVVHGRMIAEGDQGHAKADSGL